MAAINEFLYQWRGLLEALALVILLAIFSMYTRELKYSIAEARREDLRILQVQMEVYADTKSVVAARTLVLEVNMSSILTRLDRIDRNLDGLTKSARDRE